MNPRIPNLLILSSIIFVTIILNGCSKQIQPDYFRLKHDGAPPEIIAEDGKAKLIPAGYIKRRVRLGLPSVEKIIIHDRQYAYITEKWFFDVIKWTEEFIKVQIPDLDLQANYPTAYDETFAQLCGEVANLSVARKYNIKSSVLIGLMTAKNKKPWGQIPANSQSRVYIIGLTESGTIIYDIRTEQSIDLNNFPNLDSIYSFVF